MELFRNYFKQQKEFYPKKEENRKERGKDETLFEVDTFITAMCIEERDGMLYVFLPPTDYLEDYIDLVTSIEITAEKLQMPVRIEGYQPKTDYRVEKMMVTPDPGVIEVNVHPAKTWQEIVDNTSALYEEAFLCRLGTDKFMVDGRHTGTGGGNHVTLGAENQKIVRY
jgi:uncharacterized protein (DUF2126 family)